MTTVVVFGGAGFLGRRLVHRLTAEGMTVRVAVRHPDLAQIELRPIGFDRVTVVPADVRDQTSSPPPLREPTPSSTRSRPMSRRVGLLSRPCTYVVPRPSRERRSSLAYPVRACVRHRRRSRFKLSLLSSRGHGELMVHADVPQRLRSSARAPCSARVTHCSARSPARPTAAATAADGGGHTRLQPVLSKTWERLSPAYSPTPERSAEPRAAGPGGAHFASWWF